MSGDDGKSDVGEEIFVGENLSQIRDRKLKVEWTKLIVSSTISCEVKLDAEGYISYVPCTEII